MWHWLIPDDVLLTPFNLCQEYARPQHIVVIKFCIGVNSVHTEN